MLKQDTKPKPRPSSLGKVAPCPRRVPQDQPQYELVLLPGETLWVRVLERPNGAQIIGLIDSLPLMTREHGYKFGDEVKFSWSMRERRGAPVGIWEPGS